MWSRSISFPPSTILFCETPASGHRADSLLPREISFASCFCKCVKQPLILKRPKEHPWLWFQPSYCCLRLISINFAIPPAWHVCLGLWMPYMRVTGSAVTQWDKTESMLTITISEGKRQKPKKRATENEKHDRAAWSVQSEVISERQVKLSGITITEQLMSNRNSSKGVLVLCCNQGKGTFVPNVTRIHPVSVLSLAD